MGGITNQRAADSAASPTKLKELLERVALVTHPHGGGATLLFALGRITSSSRWLDGGFCVEITGNDVDSKLEIWIEREDVRERIVDATTFPVPVDELIAMLATDPTLVGSLRIVVAPRKVSLVPRESGVHERWPRDDG